MGKPVGARDLRHVLPGRRRKCPQMPVRRVVIRCAKDRAQKRPYDPKLYFAVGDRPSSQDVIAALRHRGRARWYPRRTALSPPDDPYSLEQAPHRPRLPTPTGHEHHTVTLLPLIANAIRNQDAGIIRQVSASEAVPHIHHVELEAVWLHVVARAERVVDEIVVVFQAEALR